MLLIPGGLGATGPDGDKNAGPIVEFLKGLDLSGKEGGVKWVLTVCTGSDILARAGKLEGRRATTNKRIFNDVSHTNPTFSNHLTTSCPSASFIFQAMFAYANAGQSPPPDSKLGPESALGGRREYLDVQRYFRGNGPGFRVDRRSVGRGGGDVGCGFE